MPCNNAPPELYLLKTHYFEQAIGFNPFLSQPWMCGPHFLIHLIARAIARRLLFLPPIVFSGLWSTKLTSKARQTLLLAEIYLGTHDSTNQVAECKDHNPSRPKTPNALSTIVMDFLVLGTLTLLRLLLWSLQIQLLSIVMAKGLWVKRIHQALHITLTSLFYILKQKLVKLTKLRAFHQRANILDAKIFYILQFW